MTRRERLTFWLGLLIVTLAALYLLKSVLVPFAAGMVIAYFLDPLVDRCERLGLSRTFGSLLVLLGFFLAGTGMLLLLVPLVQAQAMHLADILPRYMERISTIAAPVFTMIEAWIDDGSEQDLNLPVVAAQAGKWAIALLRQVLSGGAAIANLLSLLVITPIVAFYLLRDWDRITGAVNGWLPRAQAETIRTEIGKIDRTLSSFLRGQGSVCLILGGFYAIGLSLAGLESGIIIGLFAGLISFVPFVGTIFGGLLSIGLAAMQFDNPVQVLIIAGIFLAGQIVEGNFLTPNLVGEAVGLHPVWVMFALLAGGTLFGFLGILIAVPVAAVIGVLTRFALSRYLASPLHLQGIPPADDSDSQSTSGDH